MPKELIFKIVCWKLRGFRSRNCILENTRTHRNFKAGKSTSRLKYVQNQRFSTSQCVGSKKLTQQSIEEPMTSRSIVCRTDFTDFDMLDAMIASALKRLLDKHVLFRKRVSVEEQRAQKYDRFKRGRPIFLHDLRKSTSRLKYVQIQCSLKSQCNGSKKSR